MIQHMIYFADSHIFFKNPNQISYKTDQEPKQNNSNKQSLEGAVGIHELALIVKLLICYRFSFDIGQGFDQNRSAVINIYKK